MSNLTVRILTALVGVPVILVLLFVVPPPGLYCLVLAAVLAGTWEAHAMAAPDDRPGRFAALFASGLLSAALYFGTDPLWVATALFVGTITIMLVHLFAVGDLPSAARRLATGLGAVLWVGLLLTFVGLLHRPPYGPPWVLLALTITWLGDTGAYAAGRLFGRHKLYPQISPAKTWEGALGGLLAAVGAALLAHATYLPELSVVHALAIAIPGAVLGIVGDLTESLVKRSLGAKDSGKLLPGHGGMLDRVDALMFVAPYVYLFAEWTRVLR